MVEQWRGVIGWEAFYEVSSFGRVRSIRRFIGDAWFAGNLLAICPNASGYPRVTLSRPGQKTRCRTVHLLVLEAFVGPRPSGMWAAHNNGDSMDARLTNLRWDTPKANQADKQVHGTQLKGIRVSNAKLTDERVRLLRKSSRPISYFMGLWDISFEPIRRARIGRTWRHVK